MVVFRAANEMGHQQEQDNKRAGVGWGGAARKGVLLMVAIASLAF